MADLTTTIETLATQPASASGDSISVTMPRITDVIEADRYKKAISAAATDRMGLRFRKVKNPSAV